jgi:hypothetical protein
MVLKDAIAITGSQLAHDFVKDGPHIVTGPVEIEGAEPGDVLKVALLSAVPRVPYGVVLNRHGKGACLANASRPRSRRPMPRRRTRTAGALIHLMDRTRGLHRPLRHQGGRVARIVLSLDLVAMDFVAQASLEAALGVDRPQQFRAQEYFGAIHTRSIDQR